MGEHRQRILVVDDESANQELLLELLDALGYEAEAAGDGVLALEAVARQRPDLILLDVMMPRMDGYEVCRRLKSDPETAFIPVVIITAMADFSHRIEGINAGADDFLAKPFSQLELAARTRSLLRSKRLHDDLESAYRTMDRLASYTERVLSTFNPLHFDKGESEASLVRQLLESAQAAGNPPQAIFVGRVGEPGSAAGRLYVCDAADARVEAHPMRMLVATDLARTMLFSSYEGEGGDLDAYQERFSPELRGVVGQIRNHAAVQVGRVYLAAVNYARRVSGFEASVLKGFGVHIGSLEAIAAQILQTEDAFLYTIGALARAAEANDQDTGDHILRVNEYSRLLAEAIGLPEREVTAIHYSAQMHDVGKIHVHPDILRKRGNLDPEELRTMQRHTTAGARILGDAPRLQVAATIALCHHERWDGSGYPHRLKGEEIPVAGRIVAVADVYDALRMERSYKSAYSHAEAVRILTEGDGSTSPSHFDPRILDAFCDRASDFEAIYDGFAGRPKET